MMLLPRIRDLHEDNDWKQEYAAEQLGSKQTTYSKYALGKIGIPTESLMKLADLCGVSVDCLLGRTNKRQ